MEIWFLLIVGAVISCELSLGLLVMRVNCVDTACGNLKEKLVCK